MAKGGEFEREIAKALSLWWTFEQRDDIFYRSQASGARFTSRWKRGKKTAYQSGDITCSDPDGQPLIDYFSIECKTGYATKTKIKNQDGSMATKTVKSKAKGVVVKELSEMVRWDVLDLIDSKQKEPVLMKMWAQCKGDADVAGKQPLLIFRRNRRLPCVLFERALMEKMESYYGPPKNIILRVDGLCIMLLSDFFQWVPDMRLIIKEEK